LGTVMREQVVPSIFHRLQKMDISHTTFYHSRYSGAIVTV
jgi:hypothetical protein